MSSAFPNKCFGPGDINATPGMSLLDYFAAKALPMCIQLAYSECAECKVTHEEIAKSSYRIAIAMIRESEKQNAQQPLNL